MSSSLSKIANSTDGVNWSLAESAIVGEGSLTFYLNAFEGGNNSVVALHQGMDYPNYKTLAYYSSDGVNWSVSADSSKLIYAVKHIAFGNGKFVATDSNNRIFISADGGKTWDEVSYDVNGVFGFSPIVINSLAWCGDKFIALCSAGTMAYSSNGLSWSRVANVQLMPSPDTIVSGGPNSILLNDGHFFASSSDGFS